MLLYKCVRSLLDNSFDSFEPTSSVSTIEVKIKEIDAKVIYPLLEAYDHDDHLEKLNFPILFATCDEGEGMEATVGQRDESFFKVSIKDDIPEIKDADLNEMFEVSSEISYILKKRRRTYGLVAKLALSESKKCTGLPIVIESLSTNPAYWVVDMDTRREVNVKPPEQETPIRGWIGRKIHLIIRGKSMECDEIQNYMYRLSLITANLSCKFEFISMKRKVTKIFDIRNDKMCSGSIIDTKYNLDVVDVEMLNCIVQNTKEEKLGGFLKKEFANIKKSVVDQIIAAMDQKFSDETEVQKLKAVHLFKLQQYFQNKPLVSSTNNCLRPIGEDLVKAIFVQMLKAKHIIYHKRRVSVYKPHSCIIESAVYVDYDSSYQGIEIYGYINCLPLFKEDHDAIFRIAEDFRWSQYDLDKTKTKIGVFINIVTTGVVSISGSGPDNLAKDIKHSLKKCCHKLRELLQEDGVLASCDTYINDMLVGFPKLVIQSEEPRKEMKT